jgi:hypothetical protein
MPWNGDTKRYGGKRGSLIWSQQSMQLKEADISGGTTPVISNL